MRIPIATYRLQINDDFTLLDARTIIPYLARLGISDIYLSPVFEARAGSTHGYDVTDPTRIRESVGGIDALRALAAEAQRHHMGVLLDIVPNHMAASVENPWWKDVLTHGAASRYAHFFDIDWGTADQPKRLELPLLGDALDALIARGEIRIDRETRELVYYDTRLPLRPDVAPDGDVTTVIALQHYEPVFWRRASEHVSYRRFFDITDLAGVRVELRDVFEATHALIRRLAAEGVITGLRIDHIDGLRDPALYLRQLREWVRGPDGGAVYTVVEKILEKSERLPADWECEGTTGYEFLNVATGFLLDPAGHAATEAFYDRITGDRRAFGELVREKKLLVLERLFGGELAALSQSFAALADVPLEDARAAVASFTAALPVYRTYTVGPDVRADDLERIDAAHADASARARAESEREVLDTLHRLVSMRDVGIDSAAQLDWVMRWQQFTGPVMAKGFEDTALYCHNALLAANDVGSDPVRPALSAAELHVALARDASTRRLSLNATATHDTKRGEDTRARMAAISEVADEWRAHLRRWLRAGDEWHRDNGADEDVETPSADVQSLLYQTLVGCWPADGPDDVFLDRIKAYMTKAVREAKEQTSWRRPDEDYEVALQRFVDSLMHEFGREGLADDVGAFATRVAPHGVLNSLAQMLLKVTAPGIPDLYQGTDLWSFTLVDPDNRRPVDYAERDAMLEVMTPLRDSPDGQIVRVMLERWQDGRIKLLLTALALRFRARHHDIFEGGSVLELDAYGTHADSVFAFARSLEDRTCVVVLPRWTTRLGSGMPDGAAWLDTTIALPAELRGEWHNVITAETVAAPESLRLEQLFRYVPFALLEVSRPVGA